MQDRPNECNPDDSPPVAKVKGRGEAQRSQHMVPHYESGMASRVQQRGEKLVIDRPPIGRAFAARVPNLFILGQAPLQRVRQRLPPDQKLPAVSARTVLL